MINEIKYCQCGCGQKVNNRFVSGHNGNRKGFSAWNKGMSKYKSQLCQCGCGKMAAPKRNFIKGHQGTKKYLPERMKTKYCKCGCGEEVKWNRDFVSGHNARITKHSVKRKIELTPQFCECGCGNKAKSGKRYIYGHNAKGKSSWSAGLTKKTNKSIAAISKSLTGRNLSEEHKKSVSEGIKRKWKDPEYRRKGTQPKSLEMKEKIRRGVNRYYKKNPNAKVNLSEKQKQLWKDEEYKEKQLQLIGEGKIIHPNKPETIILNLLNKLFPKEYKFTGDYSLIINGKNPDFVNCNGQKKIIELAGDYWHEKSYNKDRAKVFKPFGYKTLVIWEHELKNINKVIKKIERFHYV